MDMRDIAARHQQIAPFQVIVHEPYGMHSPCRRSHLFQHRPHPTTIAQARVGARNQRGQIIGIADFLCNEHAASKPAPTPLESISHQPCRRDSPGSETRQIAPLGPYARRHQPLPQPEPAPGQAPAIAGIAFHVIAAPFELDANDMTQRRTRHELAGEGEHRIHTLEMTCRDAIVENRIKPPRHHAFLPGAYLRR